MALSDRRLGFLVLGVLALLAAAALFKAWPLLFPKAAVVAQADPLCDLRAGDCQLAFGGGGRVRFAITPRTIPVIEPLTLRVEVEGLDVRAVEVDFSGTDMYMGYNRVPLRPQGAGRFVGEGRIPVCVRDAMEWEAKVMLHTDRGLYVAPFRFITVKPGVAPPEGRSGEVR